MCVPVNVYVCVPVIVGVHIHDMLLEVGGLTFPLLEKGSLIIQSSGYQAGL